jgi:ATP-dependent protease ClpP protease subunit
MKHKAPKHKADKSKGTSSRPLATERALFLQGTIDEDLFRSLTPQILKLKEDVSRPITVFIDSPGGDPVQASRILGLLRAVDSNGNRPDLVTVAIGDAASAAADFLAQGDYVMAFRHASLHFHGTRTAASEITRDRAEMIEAGLEWQDQEGARRLALGMFERFLRLYREFSDEVAKFRNDKRTCEYDDLTGKGLIDIPALVGVLSGKVGDEAGSLLNASLREMRRVKVILEIYEEFVKHKIDSAILELVKSRVSRVKGGFKRCRMQLRVLEAVIASKLVEDEQWDIRTKSFQAMEADFMQVFSLAEGYFQDDVLDLLLGYKELFMDAKDFARIEAMGAELTVEQFGRNKGAQKELDAAVAAAYGKAEPLWQYVSTLCRRLNEGENEIRPEDAWHLGLIDEVIGLPLAHRTMQPHEQDAIRRSLSLADMQRFMN